MSFRSSQAGFSLIELLVSLSIFTVVITMAVGTLLVLIDANAKAQNIQTTMTNLNFVLDSMTREIRTGEGYYCSSSAGSGFRGNRLDVDDCSTGSGYLSLIEGGESLTAGAPDDQHRIEYRFNGTEESIQRRICTTDPCTASETWRTVTSPDITITDLTFFVDGTDKLAASDRTQPLVTIFVAGEAGQIDGVDTGFQLQTTITQRQLDL